MMLDLVSREGLLEQAAKPEEEELAPPYLVPPLLVVHVSITPSSSSPLVAALSHTKNPIQ